MELVRILHASDLHIAKRANLVSGPDRISAGISLRRTFSPSTVKALFKTSMLSSYDPTLLLALAEFICQDYDYSHIQQKDAPLDAILLTGDIATSGRTSDLKTARRFFEDQPDPNHLAQSITQNADATLSSVVDDAHKAGPVTIPLLLLPGNHDRLRRAIITGYSPGGKQFDHVLKKYWDPAVNAHDWGPDIKVLTVRRNSLNVSVIAADFNLKHQKDRDGRWYTKYAQGRVYQDATKNLDILGNLKQATRDVQRLDANCLVLWATHFPPQFPGISNTMKLVDDQDLVKSANELGVFAILSGHTHIPVAYQVPATKFSVFCAGTATQHHSSLGHYFQVLEIEGDDRRNATGQLVNYKFDSARSEFVRV